MGMRGVRCVRCFIVLPPSRPLPLPPLFGRRRRPVPAVSKRPLVPPASCHASNCPPSRRARCSGIWTSSDRGEAAAQAAGSRSTIVEAFGSIWLFTIDQAEWRPKGGEHISDIGPLPMEGAKTYAAEYLRSIFSPGMTAPLHVHSGPEAFAAVSGDTCLETPTGFSSAAGPATPCSSRPALLCCSWQSGTFPGAASR